MNKPKMVLFDYGQTIIAEQALGFINGNKAVLDRAVKNPHNVTVEQIQQRSNELLDEICKMTHSANRNYQPLEITWKSFGQCVFDYFDIEFEDSYDELQWAFWTGSTLAEPSENIELFLDFLQSQGIRTGIVSNIMCSKEILTKRINMLIPKNNFEFVIASSEYMFRKPYSGIFEIALKKAGLSAEDVWFCGDNPVCDINGAYNVGIQPVWYTKYARNSVQLQKECTVPEDNYITISDWKELIKIISSL
ncbi:MAG: HAD family hydrolase [Acutalibacteraceae bacterium]